MTTLQLVGYVIALFTIGALVIRAFKLPGAIAVTIWIVVYEKSHNMLEAWFFSLPILVVLMLIRGQRAGDQI